MRLRLTSLADAIPRRSDLPTLLLYLSAAGLYIAIGLITTDFLLSMPVALAYLLIVVWLVPALVRKLG
jgi:hypothetical protein